MKERVPLKAYYKSEIADLYGISVPTLIKWIEPIKGKLDHYGKWNKIIRLSDVQRIFDHLGWPDS